MQIFAQFLNKKKEVIQKNKKKFSYHTLNEILDFIYALT